MRAYCPNCDDLMPVAQQPTAGDPGLVDACASCDNLMIYDSRADYEESQRDIIRAHLRCGDTAKAHTGTEGHRFVARSRDGDTFCEYCGLPEAHADDPTALLPDGVEMEPTA